MLHCTCLARRAPGGARAWRTRGRLDPERARARTRYSSSTARKLATAVANLHAYPDEFQ